MAGQVSTWSDASPPTASPARAAGLVIRLLAFLLDSQLVVLVTWAFEQAFELVDWHVRGDGTARAWVLGILVSGLYWVLQETAPAQATFGKRALGLAVCRLDRGRLGYQEATLRFLVKTISPLGLYLPFLVAVFTPSRRALHDYAAGSFVEQRRSAGPAAWAIGVGGALSVAATALWVFAVPALLTFHIHLNEQEARTNLLALADAQARLGAQGRAYASLAVPAGRTPSKGAVAWAPSDLEAARAVGWSAGPTSYFVYRVAAAEDAEGHRAWSACAESDLDGDGDYSAWAVFQPAKDGEGHPVLEPPEAPCAFAPELARSAVRGPDDPIGHPVKLSPRDVF